MIKAEKLLWISLTKLKRDGLTIENEIKTDMSICIVISLLYCKILL